MYTSMTLDKVIYSLWAGGLTAEGPLAQTHLENYEMGAMLRKGKGLRVALG